MVWRMRKGDAPEMAGQYWDDWLGMNPDRPEPMHMRPLADRMFAVNSLVLFYRPEFRQLSGGFGRHNEDVLRGFMEWLTPTSEERTDWMDGYQRRLSLGMALTLHPAGDEVKAILATARELYDRYQDVQMTPPLERTPRYRKTIKEQKPAA